MCFIALNNIFLVKIIIICFITLAVLVTERGMNELHILSFNLSKIVLDVLCKPGYFLQY